jgi:predicted nucleotidyltransferase
MKILPDSLLSEAVRRIVGHVRPERVYLYGSHAYGIPHENSDVDILIVVKDSPLPPHKRSIEIYRLLRGLFTPFEIKVDTRDEFEQRSKWVNSIERTVREKGRPLYESAS